MTPHLTSPLSGERDSVTDHYSPTLAGELGVASLIMNYELCFVHYELSKKRTC